jgi:hypothetical protein
LHSRNIFAGLLFDYPKCRRMFRSLAKPRE